MKRKSMNGFYSKYPWPRRFAVAAGVVVIVVGVAAAPVPVYGQTSAGTGEAQAGTAETTDGTAEAEAVTADAGTTATGTGNGTAEAEADISPQPQPGASADRTAIVLEGEAAASTNFAGAPVLLYGVGENRALQLNENQPVAGGQYYADYVFPARFGGRYRLYYGGSPPGAENQLLPSYGSPFRLTVNQQEPRDVYLEDVSVGPFYSVPYLWVDAGVVELNRGVNQIRVSVEQRRRHDAVFFLYLDQLILVPEEEASSAGTGQPEPTAAPGRPERAARPDHLPPPTEFQDEFEAIEDYLITIRDDPQDIAAYIGVANLYTLVGDNINALRYLNRARLMENQNPQLLQLIARNTIWRGDINTGLERYWELINADPTDRNAYLEAGKIAAWSNFFGASEQYYLAGLQNFPNDLEMLGNLGFTYLWSNQEQEARQTFNQANRLTTSPDKVVTLGQVYELNEAPGRAAELYRSALERFPTDYRPYVRLVDVLYGRNNSEEAQNIITQAINSVEDVATAQEAFNRLSQIRDLRAQTVQQYEEAVQEAPEDLDARRRLAQTYFWIGRRAEGINVYESLLAVQTRLGLNQTFLDYQNVVWSELFARILLGAMEQTVDHASDLNRSLGIEFRNLERAAAPEAEQLPPEVEELQVLLPLLAEKLTLIADLSQEYESVLAPIVGNTKEQHAAATQELERAAESIGWSPPVEELQQELSIGADHGVLEAALTYTALVTALDQETDEIPENIAALQAEPEAPVDSMMHLLSANREGVNAAHLDSLRRTGTTAEFDSDLFGELMLFLQLYRDMLLEVFPEREEAEAPAKTEPETEATEEPPEPYNATLVEQTLERAARYREQSGELLQSAVTVIQTLRDDIETLRAGLATLTRRQLFTLQNDTSELRNRLGNLYLDVNDVKGAVRQFEMVLGVDPNNLDATYSLANAYSQMGRWRKAQDLYGTIHGIDPTYRNTVRLHNDLARQNADTFTAETTLNNESQRVTNTYAFDYLWQVNSLFSLHATFSGESVRTRTPITNAIDRQSYWRHEFLLQPSLNFRGNISGGLTAIGGTNVVSNQLYLRTDPNILVAKPLDGADYFQSYRIEPVYGLNFSLGSGAYFTEIEYRRAPYKPSSDLPARTAEFNYAGIYSDRLDAGGTINLNGLDHPVWSRFSFRTGTFANVLEREGTRPGTHYSVAQDIRAYIIRRTRPFERLALTVTGTYEDYLGTQIDEIYLPDEIVQVGGVLTYDTYRTISPSMTYGVVVRGYGGLYRPDAWNYDAPNGFRGELNTTFELTRTNVAIQFRLNYSAATTAFEQLDYYSLSGGLAVVARNVRILER